MRLWDLKELKLPAVVVTLSYLFEFCVLHCLLCSFIRQEDSEAEKSNYLYKTKFY